MIIIKELQEWYYGNCDGEWENDFGIIIETLDNPGWSVEINLVGTRAENLNFDRIILEINEKDWIDCWIENKIFNATCGALRLEEVLRIFLDWVTVKPSKGKVRKKKSE